jgi:hypothetical protein
VNSIKDRVSPKKKEKKEKKENIMDRVQVQEKL